ncbi:MAG TPA: hypothetical protein VFS52_22475 [Steroidobacteraceae bacterium]|nr:hypothetical protein [Steroidobacteraceae bacterium]
MGGAMDLDDGMGFVRATMSALVAFTVLAAGSGTARADTTLPTCHALSPEHARTLAEEARQSGDHRRAAQCYRDAGDTVAADLALARAFAESSEASTRKASATIDDAKAQARRIREALRPRSSAPRS